LHESEFDPPAAVAFAAQEAHIIAADLDDRLEDR